jgi:HlyD family secretion protein
MNTATLLPHAGGCPDTIRRDTVLGLATILVLVGGLGMWAFTTSLAGAVVGSGTVVVDGNVKKVQHPSGGVVGEIRARDGDFVQVGDILVRLDETVTRANLMVVVNQLDELAMRQARLMAERDDRADLLPPPALAARIAGPGIAEIVAGERTIFRNRRTSREGQVSQLRERIAQLQEEIAGLQAQKVAKIEEIALIRKELDDLAPLETQKLVPASKMTQLRREATRIAGERAQIVASIAQSKGKIAETELQILQVDQDMKTEVAKDLRETEGKIAELMERRISAEDTLKRIDIRAPMSGFVHQSTIHTVGGVISPSEPMMLIVPDNDMLVVEAKVAPQDIDHVRTDQVAFIRFPAFNQRTTPEIEGRVTRVSADVRREGEAPIPQAGPSFYVARIAITGGGSGDRRTFRLLPGMPAEVHFQTSSRTAISYLIKPLQDQVARAFKEN